MDIIVVAGTIVHDTGTLTRDFLDQVGVRVSDDTLHGVVFLREDAHTWEVYLSNKAGFYNAEITYPVDWEDMLLEHLEDRLGIDSLAVLIEEKAADSFALKLRAAGANVVAHFYDGSLSTS